MLTAAELARLMELASKGANLNDAEKAELAQLQAKSIGQTQQKADSAMTEADLKAAVEAAVKNATAGSVKTDDVQKIVDAAVKSIKIPESKELDQKALADAVAAAVKPGLTTEDVKGIITESLKGIRKESKMAFDDSEESRFEIPAGDRKGNLVLWQKQFLNVLTAKPMNDGVPESMLSESNARAERAEKRLMGEYGRKGITTTGVGLGKEWMALGFSSQLQAQFYLESQVAQGFLSSEVEMPTENYTYPLEGARPRFTLGGENAQISDTDIGTGNLLLKSAKLVGQISYSYEAEEDALIPVLPQMLKQLGEAAAFDYEDAVINGDTLGTQDTGTPANSALKAWDGLRKLSLAAGLKKDLATGGVTLANIAALKKLLKKYGLNPKNLMLIVGVNTYNDAILLTETLTAEKTGNANTARALTGLAPQILGIDIVPSSAIREDLNASGVYDNVTTTKTVMILVWKPGYIAGMRRGFTIEQDQNKQLQKKWVIASFRRAFSPIRPLANVQSAVTGYNYS